MRKFDTRGLEKDLTNEIQKKYPESNFRERGVMLLNQGKIFPDRVTVSETGRVYSFSIEEINKDLLKEIRKRSYTPNPRLERAYNKMVAAGCS